MPERPISMDAATARVLGWCAILAPALHSFTDVLETLQGFSAFQLWLNYVAFLPIPALMLGLYAAQRPRIGHLGLIGALLYGFAFVYFAHTTLVAISGKVPDYALLWAELGRLYTIHGGLMVAGGAIYAWASLQARVLPTWTAYLFLAGLGLNTVLALVSAPEALQPLGTLLRNAGLAGMGWWVLRSGGDGRVP